MKEGYRKIWLWLAIMMLATAIVGGTYYYGTVKEAEYDNEGTLVRAAGQGHEEGQARGTGHEAGLPGDGVKAVQLASDGAGEEMYGRE